MPGLPDAARCWIPDDKIRKYLLSTETEKGRSRHRFFTGFGFTEQDWLRLRDALLAHGRGADASPARQDQWGTTWRVVGPIVTPDGRNPTLITYWIIRADDPRPQLTSAVPGN